MPREKLHGTPSRFIPDKVTTLTEGMKTTDGAHLGGLLLLEGRIQNFKVINSNRRRYGKKLWENVFSNQVFNERLKTGEVIGLLEHPADSLTKYDRIPSHRVVQAKLLEDGDIWGQVLILNTTTGREIAAMVEGGCSIGISSRGDGDVMNVNGVQEVNPDTFVLDTWDLVHDNSVPGARLHPVQGGGFASSFGESIGSAGSPAAVPPTTQSGANAAPSGDTDEDKLAALQKKLTELNTSGASTQTEIADLTRRIADAKTRQLSQKPTHESRIPQSPMSKLPEMRKAGLEVRRLAESVRLARTFHDRAALSEATAELRRHIRTLRENDEGVEPLAKAADLELDKVDAELDKSDKAPKADGSKLADVLCDVVCTLCPDCGEKQDEVKKTVADIIAKVEAGETVDVSEALKGVMGASADPDVTGAFAKGDPVKMIESAEALVRTLVSRTKLAEGRVKTLESTRVVGDATALTAAKAEVLEGKKLLKESISEIERLGGLVKAKDGLLVTAQKSLTESMDGLEGEPVVDPNLDPSLSDENQSLRDILKLGADKVVALSGALKTALDLLGGAKVEHNIDSSLMDFGDEAPIEPEVPAVPPVEAPIVPPAGAPPVELPPEELPPEVGMNESLAAFRRNRRTPLKG